MGICDGWTVVEMGAGSVATALAGMMLADNGARVIKIEPPDGDRPRSLSPDHPIFGRIIRHGLPARFSETPGRIAPSCLLGEHTERVLDELGYDADAVDRLKATNVVAGLAP